MYIRVLCGYKKIHMYITEGSTSIFFKVLANSLQVRHLIYQKSDSWSWMNGQCHELQVGTHGAITVCMC